MPEKPQKKPEKKPEKQAAPIPRNTNPAVSNAILKGLEEIQAKRAEANRPKGYDDLLKYAKGFDAWQAGSPDLSLSEFPKNVTLSVRDVVSPYYGTEYGAQQAAAMEYAKRLSEDKNSIVKIDPKYYESFDDRLPVFENYRPAYDVDERKIGIPNPMRFANNKFDLSDKELVMNNYGSKEDFIESFKKSLSGAYRDVIEHEAIHSIDKNVSFDRESQNAWKARNQSNAMASWPEVGYMGQDNHLVTGLSKVQREYYAMTGKRFETPEEYKKFIINLAESPDQGEQISGFSEEAKRTLRSQLMNASSLVPYFERKKKHEADKSFFKLPVRGAEGNMLFFEKSAELIPALTDVGPQLQTIQTS
jgi:hypothetical protein